jgi:hypothetical protein
MARRVPSLERELTTSCPSLNSNPRCGYWEPTHQENRYG